jgi:hypothetical protein
VLPLLTALLVSALPELSDLSETERREAVLNANADELAEAMRQAPPKTLIALGQHAVSALGVYSYRMAKTERIKGKLPDEQSVDMFVKEKPFAVRLEFVKGPSSGRKVLYNEKSRAKEFRVREAGILSVLGALWIDVDSSMAKSDSNHSVKEAGMGRLLTRFESDLTRAEPQGGFKIVHEGWSGEKTWCALYFPPNGGRDFSGFKTRVCSDLVAGLPVLVETYDAKENLIERYRFSDVKPVSKPDTFFDPESL